MPELLQMVEERIKRLRKYVIEDILHQAGKYYIKLENTSNYVLSRVQSILRFSK